MTGSGFSSHGFFRWGSYALASTVLVPLLIIFGNWLLPATEVWSHLVATTLPTLIGNTLILIAGVALGTVGLGVSLAWLVSTCSFPGKRLFNWALMLPLAVPTYVMAFVFLGLADFDGPLQGALRTLFDLPAHWGGDARGAGSVILVMTLVLYPYVYMLSRVAFLGQGRNLFEAARALGLSPLRAFLQVSLPMARPAVIAGVSLALMEALADFGAVAIFNYDTFTTAIYKAWFGLFDLVAAGQLASLLLVAVLLVLTLERLARARARFTTDGRLMGHHPSVLKGWRAFAASSYCTLILGLAFVAPMVQLWIWAQASFDHLNWAYLSLLWHTLSLGFMAAVLTTAGAFVLAYAVRCHPHRLTRLSAHVGTLGYALPGSVLAVGVMLSLSWVDRGLTWSWHWLTGETLGWVFVGSVFSLLLAYFARFLAVAFGPIDSGLEQIRPSIRESAQALGLPGSAIVRRIYLPLLRPGLLTAALIVLVDVMKEMPATLLLRPFGWDTLAVRIYGLTSEGEWERAALPALTLVVVGLIPVILLMAQRHIHSPSLPEIWREQSKATPEA